MNKDAVLKTITEQDYFEESKLFSMYSLSKWNDLRKAIKELTAEGKITVLTTSRGEFYTATGM